MDIDERTATNAALWQLGLARWIKKQLHADLVD